MKLTLEQITEAIESDDYIGFCIACGAKHYGIEPDACEYTCEECEQTKVYGASEILIMGSCS